MEAKGESALAAWLQNEGGASLELGGAHWFADAKAAAGAPSAHAADLSGQLLINVCSHTLSTSVCLQRFG